MGIYDKNGYELQAAFDVISDELDYAYDSSGTQIYSKGTPPTPPTPVYPEGLTLTNSEITPIAGSPQGMATYGNYIFQFFSGSDKMVVLNKSDYSLVNVMSCTVIGHGNNLQFGDVVQQNGFPLLYCSNAGSIDAMSIYVLSINLTSLSLVETIVMPSAVGNFPNVVIDFDAEKIYTLGYTSTNIYDSSGRYIVCVLDLNNPSTVIATWQENYLGVMNGMVWDGTHIVVNVNTWNGTNVKFHFIDPLTQRIDKTEQFTKEVDSEYQGFSYEDDYYLVSKWIYKDVPSTRTLYYEFYAYVPEI